MPKQKLAELGGRLAAYRQRPCLFMVDWLMERQDVERLRAAVSAIQNKSIDVVIFSPGGDPDAAYLLGRELRRKFDDVTAFIPLYAKSGATIVCLAANELVLGDVGELGPVDVQEHEAEPGTFADYKSCLERFKALESLQRHAIETLDVTVQILLRQRMNLMDACNVAVEFTGKLMDPLYRQIQPAKVAQSARYLEIAVGYAERLLRRYRPEISPDQRVDLIRALGKGYPSHTFIIDLEELQDLGLPAREPTTEERDILTKMVRPLQLVAEERWFSVSTPRQTEEAKEPAAKKGKRSPRASADNQPEATVQRIREVK